MNKVSYSIMVNSDDQDKFQQVRETLESAGLVVTRTNERYGAIQVDGDVGSEEHIRKIDGVANVRRAHDDFRAS